jgi:hypothetical protein
MLSWLFFYWDEWLFFFFLVAAYLKFVYWPFLTILGRQSLLYFLINYTLFSYFFSCFTKGGVVICIIIILIFLFFFFGFFFFFLLFHVVYYNPWKKPIFLTYSINCFIPYFPLSQMLFWILGLCLSASVS